MKRLFLGISLLAAASVLGGCPVFPSSQEYQVCNAQACYSCPDPSYSSACTPYTCTYNSDCNAGYVCDQSQGACVAPTPGYDAGYDSGLDCSVTGCPDGQICKLSNGVAQCVDTSSGDDASTGLPDGASGADSNSQSDSSSTTGDSSAGDAGDASEGGTIITACNDDATCGGNGARCVDGQCTSQLHLCSDGSQCNVAGSACVNGICEPHCSSSTPCPTGSSCDLTRGVCNINPDGCTGSGASTCLGGTTCVEGACVPPCSTSDSGPDCPTGQVCVNGGCIADQGATFPCSNDGQSGANANTCDSTSICVHHDCYSSCSLDGGTPCSGITNVSTSVCKNVTIETGTYAVCGTATTLGSDCDPSQGVACSSGKVCVDGYCL